DPNGDSLEVISQVPYSAETVQYNYAAGYSLANPIASTAGNPFLVNAFTGTATFTPTITGLFVLAFRVNKYDRETKQLIGYTYRDVQVSVLGCQSTPPDIDSIPVSLNGGIVENTPQGNVITICAGQRANFTYRARSTNPAGIVYVETITSIPGSSFTVTNDASQNVTATFDWIPHQGNIGEHILIINAKDSTCDAGQPIVLKNFKTILIRVVPSL